MSTAWYVRDYDASDILEAINQPWGDKSDSDRKRYAQRFETSSRGFVTAILAPHTESEGDSAEEKRRLTTTYEHFDTGWIKKQTDPEYSESSNKRQVIDYDYDAAGNQTRWNTEGKRSIRRTYYPSGKVSRREAAGKTGSDGTRTERHYTYAYNENGTMDEARDLEKNRTTRIMLDDAERELLVNEDRSGGKDSSFDHDPDGNVVERETDGKWNGGSDYELSDAKQATFILDRLGREKKTTVNPENGQNRVTNTTYHPSGERETRRRNELQDGDPAVTEATYHYSDGRLSRMRRTRRGGTELKDKTYTYDRNGNRKEDERGDYSFNARDQVTKWNRGDQAKLSGSVAYDLNGSGSMTSQQDTAGGGSNTSYTYDGDRLMESQTSSGGSSTSSTYSYDDFGATTQIQSASSGGGGSQSTGMDYDEFGRMKKGQGPDGKSVTYTYDALDRRDSKTESGNSQDMSYIGTSESLSEEAGAGKDRSYDYTSDMERLGQASGDGQDSSYKGYAKDANGSVEGLEEDSGEVKSENKYSYDPYGEPEKQMGQNGQPQDPEAQLGEAAKGNPSATRASTRIRRSSPTESSDSSRRCCAP